ncbi:hypothetical protein ABIB48_000406 [Arthrobacter sp. UYCu511]
MVCNTPPVNLDPGALATGSASPWGPRACVGIAVAESFFASLKNEFYHHYSFDTRQEARRTTMRYIEVFYNRWRPHTHNDGLPPATAMANFTTQNQKQHLAA